MKLAIKGTETIASTTNYTRLRHQMITHAPAIYRRLQKFKQTGRHSEPSAREGQIRAAMRISCSPAGSGIFRIMAGDVTRARAAPMRHVTMDRPGDFVVPQSRGRRYSAVGMVRLVRPFQRRGGPYKPPPKLDSFIRKKHPPRARRQGGSHSAATAHRH